MYFRQPVSEEQFRIKYMINEEDTSIDEVFKLIAQDIASVEKKSERDVWQKTFYEEMIAGRLLPAGRILANARPSTKNRYYSNCYTIAVEDSMDGIYEAVKEDALISATGGGVGFNISKLRPNGQPTSKGGIASGPLSFLKVFNESAKIIQTGGHRRCLPLWYEVETSSGNKKIGDLLIGDLIVFEKGTFRINEVYQNGVQDLVKITAKSGWHVSTLNHRWLVYDLETKEVKWVEAKDLMEKKTYAFLRPKRSAALKGTYMQITLENYHIDPIIDVSYYGRESTIDIEVDKVHAFHAINPKASGYSSVSHNSAHIAVLNIDHPDIETFITCKQGDLNKELTQFNISAGVTDAFMKAVEEDKDWDLEFDGEVYKTVKARYLYDLLAENAFYHNEPGVLFLDRVNADNNAPDSFYIETTNPCGEIPMANYGNCNLGAINLPRFVSNMFQDNAAIAYKGLAEAIHVGVRFLDNVIDATNYPLDKVRDVSLKWRRLGLGSTGFGDLLAMLKVPYGSERSIEIASELAKFFRNESYKASIELAKEKGSYPGFNPEEIKKSSFFKRLPIAIRKDIESYGLRNVGLNTLAPTGTISLTLGQNCSSGVEPIFSLEYDRKIRTGRGDETKTERVYDFAWLLYNELNDSEKATKPDFFTVAEEIDPLDNIAVQAAWQDYIDHSISKTISLPYEYSIEEYKELFKIAHKRGLKGKTTFNPKGSIPGILSTEQKKAEALLVDRDAPKRPEELPCDIHEISVNKERFIVLCGFYEGYMYEIFVTPDPENAIDIQKHKKGFIKKVKKGRYDLIVKNCEDKIILQNIGKLFDQTFGSLSRFISMSLRHGVSLPFIVDQLQKDQGFASFERVVSRILKKYIKDGEKSTHKCDVCSDDLEFRESCLICPSCGNSKCS